MHIYIEFCWEEWRLLTPLSLLFVAWLFGYGAHYSIVVLLYDVPKSVGNFNPEIPTRLPPGITTTKKPSFFMKKIVFNF